MRLYMWALIQYDQHLSKRRKFGHTERLDVCVQRKTR